MIRKYRYLLTAAAAVGAAGLLTFAARNDFGLGRNMEIAVNMMRELSVYYVDEVDADQIGIADPLRAFGHEQEFLLVTAYEARQGRARELARV